MDENNIQMVWEDLTVDFQALAKMHTTVIESLLKEFNNDQLLHMLETERAFTETVHDQTDKAMIETTPQPNQEQETPTTPAMRTVTEYEPDFSAEQTLENEPEPAISAAMIEETIVHPTTEGILDILIEEWVYHIKFVVLFDFGGFDVARLYPTGVPSVVRGTNWYLGMKWIWM